MPTYLRLAILLLPHTAIAEGLQPSLSLSNNAKNITHNNTLDWHTAHRNAVSLSPQILTSSSPIADTELKTSNSIADSIDLSIITSLAPLPIPPWPSTPNALSALLPALETFYGSAVPTCWPCNWGSTLTSAGESTIASSAPPPSQTTQESSGGVTSESIGMTSSMGPITSSSTYTEASSMSDNPSGSSPTTAPTQTSEEPTSASTSGSSSDQSTFATSDQSTFATSTTQSAPMTSDLQTSTSSTSSSLPSDFVAPAPPASLASRVNLSWLGIGTILVTALFSRSPQF